MVSFPARAASIAALRASRLVCSAMPALPGQPWTADVALVPLAEPAPTISFHLVWRDDRNAAVDAFISAARRVRARHGWVAGS